MTRQEQISYLGEKAKISEFNGEKNFLSYFIIPVPHKFYEKRKPLEDVKKSGWKILNLKSEENNQKRIFDFNNDLKKYIYEGLMPKKTEKEFKKEKSNIVLQKKIYNDIYEVEIRKDKYVKVILDEIDLWILEKNIAFFVIKFKLPRIYNYLSGKLFNWKVNVEVNLNELAIVNRILRDFRNVNINKNKITSCRNGESNFIDWLIDLTRVDNKSFLNIKKQDFEKEEFYPIYNSTHYSKLLTAVHVTVDDDILHKIEPPTQAELKKIEIDGTDTIEEMPFLLASTSDCYPIKMWESNENYINEMVNKGGINIWKYWSGIALKDSLAFFSVNEGGGMIVSSCKGVNYFIYILNLYINYRIKLLEHSLIMDQYFVDIEKNLKNLEEVQRLHNMYMSEEIAIRFQPNEIHQAIMRGMELKELFNEVEENIKNTYERSKENTALIISAFSFMIAIISLLEDKIIEFIKIFYNTHPEIAIIVGILILILIVFIIIKRKTLYKRLAELKREFFRNVL